MVVSDLAAVAIAMEVVLGRSADRMEIESTDGRPCGNDEGFNGDVFDTGPNGLKAEYNHVSCDPSVYN